MLNEMQKSWLAEKRSAYLYDKLALKETEDARKKLFSRLQKEAEEQAKIWQMQLQQAGRDIPKQSLLDLRTRLVAKLIGIFNPRSIQPILASAKIRGLSVYTHSLPTHETPTSIEELGRKHRRRGSSGNLRAAVFGVNDGLVSNAALIAGVSGAALTDSHGVLMTGVAGLLAGAFSMAAGEYVSVLSQREMFEYQIGLEAEELKLYPKEEEAELVLIFEARGIEKSQAEEMASKLIQNPERALDTLAREELGLDPNELGSPTQAALSSFISFSVGALIPIIPFLVCVGEQAFQWVIISTLISLWLIGAATSLFTGKSAITGAFRMLLIGSAAGLLTYWIGHILGSLP